jgi:hypothetical protein
MTICTEEPQLGSMRADRSSSRDHTPSLRFANRPQKHGESPSGHIECADYISDIS